MLDYWQKPYYYCEKNARRKEEALMNVYFYVLTTIDLFVLGFMCILTKLSESLNYKQKRGFFCAFILIAAVSVLEVITLAVDGAPPGYRWLNVVSNYLGFGLSPGVAVCLVYVLDKKTAIRRELRIAIYCEIVYLIFLAVSVPSGLVFSVSAENIYSRGPYFYIYVFMYFVAIMYLSISTIITAKEFQNRSRRLIYPLIFFLTAETIIQVTLPDLHVTWLCVTLLSILYFIYCNEMWTQLDALTGLLNQNSYLNRTAEVKRTGGVLIVFDVDDFKNVNDQYGHLKGDICLSEIADCIKKAYAKFGYCYRIGGDEFCVLMKNVDQQENCLKKFIELLEEKRRRLDYLPTISFGSCFFSGEDILTIKDRADQNMYRFKKERKENDEHGQKAKNTYCR